MKTYHLLQPEVIVGLGDNTEFIEATPPFKTLKKLHIHLEDWLGDDLMENSGNFIVTKQLKEGLERNFFANMEFLKIEVTKDEYFDDNYRLNKPLPVFYWVIIKGSKNVSDIFIEDGESLYASEEFIGYIKNNFSAKYLDIDPEKDEFDDLLDKMIAERKNE